MPYKARKNSKKEQINIDCNNENILKEDSNKKDKLSKYEIDE